MAASHIAKQERADFAMIRPAGEYFFKF